jgi:DNA-binding MarR family transcriptional regulator
MEAASQEQPIDNLGPGGTFDLEGFLPYRLSQLSNTVSQGIAQIYQADHRISIPEWRVMAVLGRYPGLTASQVCERTVMDKVTVSRAVKMLLDRQLVRRLTHADDRRKRPLQVTHPQGHKLLEEIIPFALDYQAELLGSLEPGEWRLLDKLIAKLFQASSTLNQRRNEQKKDRES